VMGTAAARNANVLALLNGDRIVPFVFQNATARVRPPLSSVFHAHQL
jgi:hypothetical protein